MSMIGKILSGWRVESAAPRVGRDVRAALYEWTLEASRCSAVRWRWAEVVKVRDMYVAAWSLWHVCVLLRTLPVVAAARGGSY